jgi:hypothetical protein
LKIERGMCMGDVYIEIKDIIETKDIVEENHA